MALEFSDLSHSPELKAWQDGEISVGKMAELLGLEKEVLREHLADLKLPIIDLTQQEVIDEANYLLSSYV